MTVEIRIQDDDSLEVSGKFDLFDEDGNSYPHHGKLRLCRCGASKTKPYCDNAHFEAKFESKIWA
ncbi:MAG TPA: CDGSH iron-sulfur domain-containing protein [Dehalococcoidia bacterium]|nr:iron-binding protein [Chloroflexota bacterium]MBH65982.1 iron-binding protein [Chloroflexota bacterium]HCI86962.1 CDGSH iron-sulfur domain-containing protein [Dehalococcoidia bacterium]|tara:strand:+ start:4597 stop:4791 length:195 start_codon:yes stop_codon:yes gene_type:complete